MRAIILYEPLPRTQVQPVPGAPDGGLLRLQDAQVLAQHLLEVPSRNPQRECADDLMRVLFQLGFLFKK